ncbi:tRNA methyltransferase complex GCD14 subunit [Thozetella sp. PMI_491]|nr:tRNA methyltransferase complex GCD14 subunit [Thozetella sp. PMI_491]
MDTAQDSEIQKDIMSLQVSPFLDPGPRTKPGSLAIIQLSRDNLVPTYLQEPSGEHDGYAEGHVLNTRYGSFPHSTLLGVPWGSQIRASKVDTGSRGKKRKRTAGKSDDIAREDLDDTEATPDPTSDRADETKEAVVASSGFLHILPPTAENWTLSLPHRTQVVYTPDYSYILHRIRARPGTRLIEAGAGSGSFSHASARAVYNGYPRGGTEAKGKVFSFEFHEQRYNKMKQEISEHGLDGIIRLTHRDVYKNGFGVEGENMDADAVFLDLPAPWDALPHLTRSVASAGAKKSQVSVLNPKKSVHLCTFSPCIEQVTRTVSTMRRLGWLNIEMVEIAHRKLYTARERVGLYLPADRGVNVAAKDVEEAIMKLSEIEDRTREHNAKLKVGTSGGAEMDLDDEVGTDAQSVGQNGSKGRHEPVAEWMDGQLSARGEPEIKAHTSYLVFAILPQLWTEEDEAAALAKWPVGEEKNVIGKIDKATRKKERREWLQEKTASNSRKKQKKQGKEASNNGTGKTGNSTEE